MQKIGLSKPEYLDQLAESVRWKLSQNSSPTPIKSVSQLKIEKPLPLYSTQADLNVAIPKSELDSLKDLTVDVNGVREILDPKQSDRFQVRLLPGDNRIVISGRTESGQLRLRTHQVFCDRPAAKAKTWFVGIGVSEYQDSARNLSFRLERRLGSCCRVSRVGR